MITFDELIKQHAELWPETNLNQQVVKLNKGVEHDSGFPISN